MNTLAQIQRDFLGHVINNETAIAACIVGNAAASVATRLDVYANGYRLRLIEVLEQDFPGVRALLGAPAFDVLARGYIAAQPSAHYSLRRYGQHLAGHLARLPIDDTRPELAEMADFEWCWGECFDAADAAPTDIDALAAVPPPAWLTLRLGFLPGTRRTTTRFNIAEVWQAVKDDATVSAVERLTAPTQLLLWRHGFNVRWRALEPDEAAVLAAAQAGRDFPELCDALIAAGVAEDDVPMRAATLVKRWLHEGLISELRIGAEPATNATTS